MSRDAPALPGLALADTIAARQAVIGEATDPVECARRLRAAGYDDAAIRLVLGEDPAKPPVREVGSP